MGYPYNRAFKNKWLGQPKTAAGVVPPSAGLAMPAIGGIRGSYFRMQYRGASTAAIAMIALLKDTAWELRQWIDATTSAATDKTAQAQEGTTNDVPLETTTVNDGFIVGADI